MVLYLVYNSSTFVIVSSPMNTRFTFRLYVFVTFKYYLPTDAIFSAVPPNPTPTPTETFYVFYFSPILAPRPLMRL